LRILEAANPELPRVYKEELLDMAVATGSLDRAKMQVETHHATVTLAHIQKVASDYYFYNSAMLKFLLAHFATEASDRYRSWLLGEVLCVPKDWSCSGFGKDKIKVVKALVAARATVTTRTLIAFIEGADANTDANMDALAVLLSVPGLVVHQEVMDHAIRKCAAGIAWVLFNKNPALEITWSDVLGMVSGAKTFSKEMAETLSKLTWAAVREPVEPRRFRDMLDSVEYTRRNEVTGRWDRNQRLCKRVKDKLVVNNGWIMKWSPMRRAWISAVVRAEATVPVPAPALLPKNPTDFFIA
jgi:hypothetical protein